MLRDAHFHGGGNSTTSAPESHLPSPSSECCCKCTGDGPFGPSPDQNISGGKGWLISTSYPNHSLTYAVAIGGDAAKGRGRSPWIKCQRNQIRCSIPVSAH